MIEALCVVFVTVVGPQVEVCADLHLLGEEFDDISPKGLVSDSFEPFRLELRPEVVQDRVRRWRLFTGVAQRGDRGSIGGRADEDLVNVLGIDFSVIRQGERNFLVKPVDEEVKKLVFVDFTVRLLCLLGHNSASGLLQLASFVRY
ncbi:hypothetical protein C445_07760 [Halobiforma lacisalsi AJ5]|uniref:Uncharacterized protein n=1 Tax=Natronobacterium lacisalsi AJ5 TaxID=358396 RepID=M0LMR3_NATLA|nr:hypothetical protein C445_07760 [Halobiforma lacisalsi AJ5]